MTARHKHSLYDLNIFLFFLKKYVFNFYIHTHTRAHQNVVAFSEKKIKSAFIFSYFFYFLNFL